MKSKLQGWACCAGAAGDSPVARLTLIMLPMKVQLQTHEHTHGSQDICVRQWPSTAEAEQVPAGANNVLDRSQHWCCWPALMQYCNMLCNTPGRAARS
jgi:hypothetical protein